MFWSQGWPPQPVGAPPLPGAYPRATQAAQGAEGRSRATDWSPHRRQRPSSTPGYAWDPHPGAENQTHLVPQTKPPQPVLGPRSSSSAGAIALAVSGPCLQFPAAPDLPPICLLRAPHTCCFLSGLVSSAGSIPVTPPGIQALSLGLPTSLGSTFARCSPSPSQASHHGAGWAGTHWPRDVCTSSVTSVDVAGQMQFRASMAYLHSSSHTT